MKRLFHKIMGKKYQVQPDTLNDRQYYLIFRISFFNMLLGMVAIPILYFLDAPQFVGDFIIECTIGVIILSILRFSKTHKPAAIVFCLYNFIAIASFTFSLGGVITFDMGSWLILLILYANFNLGRKWGLSILAATVFFVIYCSITSYLNSNYIDTSVFEARGAMIMRTMGLIFTLVFIFITIVEYFKLYSNEYIFAQTTSERLELAVEGSKTVIWEWNLEEGRAWFNEQIKNVLGYEVDFIDEDPKSWVNYIHPEDREGFIANLQVFMRANLDHYSDEYRIRTFDGDYRWLMVRGRVTKRNEENGRITHIAGTYIDITDRKLAEQELVTARDKAEAASRAKAQFLSTMSHEIRTPLNGVVGITNLLIQEDPREDQLENLKILQFSSNHLLSLINDILDFSKIEAGRIEFEEVEFVLSNLTSSIAQALRLKAEEKNITLELQRASNLPYTLIGDPVRLNQVLLNLVGNAVKFTENGSVNLEIDVLDESSKEIELRFRVVDTGIGIPPEKVEKLFQSFTQANSDTTRKYGGTGLGLAISRKLVELQGGRIGVTSKMGEGSTFYFSMVFRKGSEITQRAKSAIKKKRDKKSLNGIRVLIVEDNQVNQKIASKFLTKWNARVEVANNGREAVDKVEIQSYDLILMDLQMPEMDGFEATKAIRGMSDPLRSRTPIIALTASALLEVQEEVAQAGMNDFATKPFNPQDLFQKIAKNVAMRV